MFPLRRRDAESLYSILWVNQERTAYSALSLLLGMNSTTGEMQKQLGVEGREQWQEAGISLSWEKMSPGK